MFFKIVSIIGSITMLSRILGYARDLLIAKILGAGLVSDAFFVSFKLPNLFRRLFAEGSVSSAFIPVVSGINEKKGELEANKFLSEVISIIFSFLLILIIFIEIFMPFIIFMISPGFIHNSEKYNLTVYLARITLPFLLFISISSLIGGYLNTLGKFAAMAFIPVILNLCMLCVLVFFVVNPQSKEEVSSFLAMSISLAGIFQLIWLIFHYKRNGHSFIFKKINFFKISKEGKRLILLFLPAALGNGVYQLNLLIDMILASTLVDGSISYLYFADRINQLPLGVLGIALSTALLPILSKKIKQKKYLEVNDDVNECLQIGIVFTLPCVVGLFMLSEPIINVLFVRGAFTSLDGLLTSRALEAFCFGLPAFILIKILVVNFYAREDTKTPVYVAFIAVILNLILNLILIKEFMHVGLAIATSISAWLNCIILYVILKKKLFIKIKLKTYKIFYKSFIASILTAIFINYSSKKLIFFEIESFFEKIISLSGIIFLSFVLYLTLIYFLRIFYLLRFKIGEKN